MKNFYLICNPNKDKDFVFSNRIVKYLEERGASCDTSFCGCDFMRDSCKYTNAACIPQNTDCILVVGGDGTFIQAARDVVSLQIPLFGINMGTLGYLTETDESDIESALDHLLRDEWFLENRMLISGSVERDGKIVYQDIAFNDAVLCRRGTLQVFTYELFVNGESLVELPADGIIVATPTGSTAYSYSAGGPIVMPNTQILVITPICAHSSNARSIVLPSNLEIDIHLGNKVIKPGSGQMVSFDGDAVFDMKPGDILHLSAAKQTVPMARINKIGFLETLRQKLS